MGRLRKCFIEGCSSPQRAKNLCIRHYQEGHYLFRKRKRLRQYQGKEIASLTKLSRGKAIEVVRVVWQVIAEALKRQETVTITGLGTFSIRDSKVHFRAARDIEQSIQEL